MTGRIPAILYAQSVSSTKERTRRFGSLDHVAKDLFGVGRASPALWRVFRGGISPDLRERIMVGVSRANACAGCTRAHQRLALRAGVTNAELESIGLGDLARLDEPSRAAVVYAVERSGAAFPGPAGAPSTDPDVAAAMTRHFSPEETGQVDAIARLITFANLSVGSVEALHERLRG